MDQYHGSAEIPRDDVQLHTTSRERRSVRYKASYYLHHQRFKKNPLDASVLIFIPPRAPASCNLASASSERATASDADAA